MLNRVMPGDRKRTLLIRAALNYNNELIQELLEAGANPMHKDADGHDAFYYTVRLGNGIGAAKFTYYGCYVGDEHIRAAVRAYDGKQSNWFYTK